MSGMVLNDLTIPIPINLDIEIRKVEAHEMMEATDIALIDLNYRIEISCFFHECCSQTKTPLEMHGYLAYIKGEPKPVAMSYLLYLPKFKTAWLRATATRIEYRNQGIYQSLVARRLADAQSDGMERAIIHAQTNSSAPICSKLGFREICQMFVYEWHPELT